MLEWDDIKSHSPSRYDLRQSYRINYGPRKGIIQMSGETLIKSLVNHRINVARQKALQKEGYIFDGTNILNEKNQRVAIEELLPPEYEN